MVKETKIGLALIGGLLVTFAGILGHRLTTGEDPQAALLEQAEGLLDDAQQQAQDALDGVVDAAQEAIEQAPTVVAAAAGDDSGEQFASDEPQLDESSPGFLPPSSAVGDRYAATGDDAALADEPAAASDEPAAFVEDEGQPSHDPFSRQARAPALTDADPEEIPDAVEAAAQPAGPIGDERYAQSSRPIEDAAPAPQPEDSSEPYASDNPLYDAQDSVGPAPSQPVGGDRSAQRPGAGRAARPPADEPAAAEPAEDRYAAPQPGERYATTAEDDDRYAAAAGPEDRYPPAAEEPAPQDPYAAGDVYATDDQDDERYAQPLPADERYAAEPADEERYAADPPESGERYPAEGAAQPAAPRPPRARDAYVVQQDENYWRISERLYGTGFYAGALEEHNRSRIPEDSYLQAGDEISAPPASVLEQTYPHLCPRQRGGAAAIARGDPPPVRSDRQGRRIYIVQEGDTLFDIARHQLGRAGLWVQIYDLNRQRLGDDVDRLEPGMELLLPPPRSARR